MPELTTTFDGILQRRYPIHQKGRETAYKLLEHMTAEELVPCISRLREQAASALRYADALQAFADGQGGDE